MWNGTQRLWVNTSTQCPSPSRFCSIFHFFKLQASIAKSIAPGLAIIIIQHLLVLSPSRTAYNLTKEHVFDDTIQ